MPGTISVACPNCKKKGIMRVSPGQTGKVRINCPNCGTKFQRTIDRRSYYRKIPLPSIRFGRLNYDFTDLPYRGELVDISVSGCRIRFDGKPPEKSAQLSLYFRLPSAEPPIGFGGDAPTFDPLINEYVSLQQSPDVRVGGEVVWIHETPSEGCEFGVRFTYQDEHAKKTIGFYLFPYHEPLTRK